MNILCITHADFETPGVIEDWAKRHNHAFTIIKPYRGDLCSNYAKTLSFDLLIVMGGPQSPLQLAEDPYLKDEIELIKQAIHKDKKVIGFCLGAQLIGEALGTTTSRSPEKEVGVYPITLTEEGLKDPLLLDFPKSFPVIHWHNDMPGETVHSTLLATSQGCPKQVIRYSPKIYGFQCHLEITKQGIQSMIEACPGDLKPSKFTQSIEDLLSKDYAQINQYMFNILDKLILV